MLQAPSHKFIHQIWVATDLIVKYGEGKQYTYPNSAAIQQQFWHPFLKLTIRMSLPEKEKSKRQGTHALLLIMASGSSYMAVFIAT